MQSYKQIINSLYFVARFLALLLLHTTAITAKVMATTRNNRLPIIPPITVDDRPKPSSETEVHTVIITGPMY